MRSEKLGNLLILLCFVLAYISLIVGALHLLGNKLGINMLKALLPFVGFSIFTYYFLMITIKNHKINTKDFFVLLLFFTLLIFSSVIGLARGFSYIRIFIDFMTLFIPFALFIIIKNLKISLPNIEIKLYKLSKIFIVFFFFYFLFLYFMYYVLNIRFNLTFGSALLPLITTVLFHKNKKLFFFSVILVILSGKRNIILFTLLVAATYYLYIFFRIKKKHFYQFTSISIIIFLISSLFVLFNFDLLMSINPKLQKILYLNVFSESYDPYKFSSGRIHEVQFAMDTAKNYFGYWLIGSGSGFSYIYDIPQLEEERHNLHISVISLFFKYGLILTVFYYVVILKNIINSYKVYKNNPPFVIIAMYTFWFIIFFSNTEYALVTEYAFWILLGLISNHSIMDNYLKNKIPAN